MGKHFPKTPESRVRKVQLLEQESPKYPCVCVCARVCVRERETERDRERKRERLHQHKPQPALLTTHPSRVHYKLSFGMCKTGLGPKRTGSPFSPIAAWVEDREEWYFS